MRQDRKPTSWCGNVETMENKCVSYRTPITILSRMVNIGISIGIQALTKLASLSSQRHRNMTFNKSTQDKKLSSSLSQEAI